MTTIANIKSKFSNLYTNKMFHKTVCTALVLLMSATSAYAADPAGMDTLDNVIQTMSTWLGRIGLIVAFFGGIQMALGFKQDDAEGKIRGMKTSAAGFLVFGLTQTMSLFGL